MRNILLLAILSFLVATPALAQSSSENHPPQSIKPEDNSFLTLTLDNDLFASAIAPDKDANYSSGMRLTYFDDKADPPKLIKALGDAVPFFNGNKTTNVYYSIGQSLYTPVVFATVIPDPTDRPYAGFLYGSVGYSALSDDRIDDIEVTFGVVGPAALGEQVQKFAHDLVGHVEPRGWDSQLKDEPALILSYQRIWPEALSADLGQYYLRVTPYAGVKLGNVHTYTNKGVTFQLVPERHKKQAPPARIRPAILGADYSNMPEDEFSWSIFAGTEFRVVARDIFLDGNTFRDSPSVDKKQSVLDANIGFTITYGRAQMSYTLNWRSEEFVNQPHSSVFGSVVLSYPF